MICIHKTQISHHFLFASRLRAEINQCCKFFDNILGGILGGNLGGNLGGILSGECRPHSSGCHFGKWNGYTEHISLFKYRIFAGIHIGIFISISHAGAKLISKSDFPKYLGNWRIFLEWLKRDRIEYSITVRKIRIFSKNPVFLYDQLGNIPTGVITMSQEVRDDLTENMISCADALDAVQVKGVIQVLLSESK